MCCFLFLWFTFVSFLVVKFFFFVCLVFMQSFLLPGVSKGSRAVDEMFLST